MKAKLKIDGKAIKEFFAQNTEKIVFAAVVVCFALIVYSAGAREMLPRTGNQTITPDKLASFAGDAKEAWERRALNPEDYKTPDYLAIVGRSQVPIEETNYPLEKPFDRSVIQQRRPRGEPPLYTVEGLRGGAGCGQVSMVRPLDSAAGPRPAGPAAAPRVMPNMGGASLIQGQRWVVLTGLVAIEKQVQDYYDYFKTAQLRTANDVPIYVGYVVQRVEVSGADSGEPPDWSKGVTFYSGAAKREATDAWTQTTYMAQEVADPKFLDKDQRLLFPLPPLVGGQWDESVVHEPEIPLLLRTDQGYPETGVAPSEGEKSDDPYAVQGPTRGYYGPSRPDSGSGPVAPPRAVFDDPTYSGREIGPMGPGTRGYGPSVPGHYGPGAYAAGPYIPGQTGQGVKHYLFRFFDLKAEAGKRYRYRVRLVLQNPNLGVEDSYLSKDVLNKKQRIEEQAKKLKSTGDGKGASTLLRQWQNIESDWANPTEVISVPRDSRLLALSVQAPPRIAEEPSGKVLVICWVKDRGIEAFAERPVDRGKVANFPGCRFPETKPLRPSQKKAAGELPMYVAPERMGLEGGVEDAPLVDYLTDALVLDMDGGELLPGKDRLTQPGAMLLLDSDGTLVVRQELDDLAKCNELRERNLPPGRGGPGHGYGPGYEGYGPQPGYEGYGPQPGYQGYGPGRAYDGYGPGRGRQGNLDGLRGGGGSYDGPVNKGSKKPPQSTPRRGGAS